MQAHKICRPAQMLLASALQTCCLKNLGLTQLPVLPSSQGQQRPALDQTLQQASRWQAAASAGQASLQGGVAYLSSARGQVEAFGGQRVCQVVAHIDVAPLALMGLPGQLLLLWPSGLRLCLLTHALSRPMTAGCLLRVWLCTVAW